MAEKPTFDEPQPLVAESEIIKFERKRELDAIEAFFNHSPAMLFIADIKKNALVRINDEVIRITGRSRKDLVSMSFLEFIHPEDHRSTMKAMGQLAEGMPLVGYQNRHLTANGEVRVFEWNAVPDLKRNLIYAIAQVFMDQKQTGKPHNTERNIFV